MDTRKILRMAHDVVGKLGAIERDALDEILSTDGTEAVALFVASIQAEIQDADSFPGK